MLQVDTVGPEAATVSRLMSALGSVGHMDIRLRVQTLVETNCQEEQS